MEAASAVPANSAADRARQSLKRKVMGSLVFYGGGGEASCTQPAPIKKASRRRPLFIHAVRGGAYRISSCSTAHIPVGVRRCEP
ncbi:hypothetical protein COA18_11755 [Priestia megaterium]|nr:hypothetical protein COA18_11755 [Priestia megaterium]